MPHLTLPLLRPPQIRLSLLTFLLTLATLHCPAQDTLRALTPSSPDPELEYQIHRLASEHGQDRHQSIHWLSTHPDLSRPALLDLLHSQASDWHKQGALKALAPIVQPDDLPLLDTLRNQPALRWDALIAMSAIHSDLASSKLIAYTKTADQDLATDAIIALGYCPATDVRPDLESLLAHPSPTYRWKAVHAISILDPTPSKSILQARKAQEPDRNVRDKLTEVLKQTSK